jgi:hypothetical protein
MQAVMLQPTMHELGAAPLRYLPGKQLIHPFIPVKEHVVGQVAWQFKPQFP